MVFKRIISCNYTITQPSKRDDENARYVVGLVPYSQNFASKQIRIQISTDGFFVFSAGNIFPPQILTPTTYMIQHRDLLSLALAPPSHITIPERSKIEDIIISIRFMESNPIIKENKRKTMRYPIILTTLLLAGTAAAFSISKPSNTVESRRDFLAKSAITAAITTATLPKPALAEYEDYITTESGMQYKITKEAPEDAAVPTAGQTVKAHYTGWLDGFDSEKKFDSSRDRGRPFTFKVGAGQVIRGWDEAFSTMKVGERRNIVLPARLAYGDRGGGGIIPGGATLYFDVELLSIL
jgi:peptidylprolyl isomerase